MLGEIVATFGLRGEVKLLSQTDFPERIGMHKTLYLGPDHQPIALQGAKEHGGVILLSFVDVADLTAAEKLRGKIVSIPQTEAAPLAADQYYIHDLVGLQAIHSDGRDLGSVVDIIIGTAQDLLVVKRVGHPQVLVPLVKAIVPTIDLAARTVTIDPPIGLFDGDAEDAGDGN